MKRLSSENRFLCSDSFLRCVTMFIPSLMARMRSKIRIQWGFISIDFKNFTEAMFDGDLASLCPQLGLCCALDRSTDQLLNGTGAHCCPHHPPIQTTPILTTPYPYLPLL